MTTECQGCVRAARRMLLESIDTTCDACGAVFSVDAEVLDAQPHEPAETSGARSSGVRSDEAGTVGARPAEEPARAPRARKPLRRGEDLRSLLCLSESDRAKVQETIDENARWGRIRLIVEALLRWEHTEAINEKSASSCTNGSNWLRGVVGLVGSDTLKARPDLKQYAKAPLWVGPGHDGSVGDMSTAMPEPKVLTIEPTTIERFNALSERARRTATAIKDDGQGDQLVSRVLRDGQLPVALGLEQRLGLDLAPAEVRMNWYRLLGSGDRAPMLAGSKQYGWEALCELEAEWNGAVVSAVG